MSVDRLRELEAQLAALQADDMQGDEKLHDAGSDTVTGLLSSAAADDAESVQRPVPTLQQLCVDNIGTNMHLYACLQGLPEFVTDQLLQQFKTHFSSRHCKLRDDNISNYLDLALARREAQGRALTVLNLRWAEGISDTALELVAARCPALRELDLGFCTAVGDGGLRLERVRSPTAPSSPRSPSPDRAA